MVKTTLQRKNTVICPHICLACIHYYFLLDPLAEWEAIVKAEGKENWIDARNERDGARRRKEKKRKFRIAENIGEEKIASRLKSEVFSTVWLSGQSIRG